MSNDPSKPHGTDVQEPEEEVAHLDDAVIGRAFRWSILALLLIVALAVGLIWYAKRKPAAGPTKVTSITAPVAAQRTAAQMPTVAFTDITKEAGINFLHNNGAYGDKLLPETMGSGVAFLDYDNDGDQDLLFVNCTSWPWKGGKATTPILYQNDGTGKFTDVTAGSGLDVPIFGMGIAIVDYNKEGREGIVLSRAVANRC